MSESFEALVRRSLEILRNEHPVAFAALARRLGRNRLRFVIDGRPFDLTGDGFTVVVGRAEAVPIAELSSSRRALVDLVRGKADLIDELRRDRIALKGQARALWQLHEALLAYLQGAVRCPSFPGLQAEFEHGA
jgi:hypothetical protein